MKKEYWIVFAVIVLAIAGYTGFSEKNILFSPAIDHLLPSDSTTRNSELQTAVGGELQTLPIQIGELPAEPELGICGEYYASGGTCPCGQECYEACPYAIDDGTTSPDEKKKCSNPVPDCRYHETCYEQLDEHFAILYWGIEDVPCCGRKCMEPGQVCCSGKIHDFKEHYRCCGRDYIDSREETCCNIDGEPTPKECCAQAKQDYDSYGNPPGACNEGEGCCNYKCYDLEDEVCCVDNQDTPGIGDDVGNKKPEKEDYHCCNDGSYISNCACCDYTLKCYPDSAIGDNMGITTQNAPPPYTKCRIVMSESAAAGFGYSCKSDDPEKITNEEADEVLNQWDNNNGEVTSIAQCMLIQEATHMNQAKNGDLCEKRVCETETEGWTKTINCINKFITETCQGSTSAECNRARQDQFNLKKTKEGIECTCAKTSDASPTITEDICRECFGPAFEQAACSPYCSNTPYQTADYCSQKSFNQFLNEIPNFVQTP